MKLQILQGRHNFIARCYTGNKADELLLSGHIAYLELC